MSGREAWARTHEAPGGDRFRLRGWRSPAGARTSLVVHHGLGEHGGRYDRFAHGLGDLPVDVVTYDLRGHGESTGRRGDVAGLEGLAADLEAVLPVLLAETGADRVVLMGHSLGAASVGWYLTTRSPHPAIAAVLLSAAPVYVPRTLQIRAKAAVARVLRRVAPRFTMGSGLDPAGISSDPAEVQRYTADPQIHDRISVRLGLSILNDAPRIVEDAGRIRLPALVWHGSDDPIADVRGGRALAAALGSEDRQYHELDGYRHEAHHETPERALRLFGLIRDWLGPRIGR